MAAGKDEIAREMIKHGRSDIVIDWVWKLCNIVFESEVESKDGNTLGQVFT